MDQGCPFCWGGRGSHGHVVGRCKGIAAGSRNIEAEAVEAWEQVRSHRFSGVMGRVGMPEVRELIVDAVEEVLARFVQIYPISDACSVGFGGESVEVPFARGQAERWPVLNTMGWIVREGLEGTAGGRGQGGGLGEAEVGGAEDGWVYGLIPRRIIEAMEGQVREMAGLEGWNVEVGAEVEPYLLDMHGALVVGGYALCCVYEAEVEFWSKAVDRSFGWGFFHTQGGVRKRRWEPASGGTADTWRRGRGGGQEAQGGAVRAQRGRETIRGRSGRGSGASAERVLREGAARTRGERGADVGGGGGTTASAGGEGQQDAEVDITQGALQQGGEESGQGGMVTGPGQGTGGVRGSADVGEVRRHGRGSCRAGKGWIAR